MKSSTMTKILLTTLTTLFLLTGLAFGDDSLYVHPSGKVGIGISDPETKLHVAAPGSGPTTGIQLQNNAGNANICIALYWPGPVPYLAFRLNGEVVLALTGGGDASFQGEVSENSDASLKDNVKTIDNALVRIANLRGVTYDWKDKARRGDKRHIGLIVDELEKEFPDAVRIDPEGYKSISYTRLVAPLIEAVKELKAENDDFKRRVAALEKAIAK